MVWVGLYGRLKQQHCIRDISLRQPLQSLLEGIRVVSERVLFIEFVLLRRPTKGKGMILCSAIASPLDYSKSTLHFALWQTCSFRHQLDFRLHTFYTTNTIMLVNGFVKT